MLQRTKTITVYSDPGHGWAKVHIQELLKLNIAHKITPYSYMRGNWVYLEEDCDLTTYVTALSAAGIPYKYKEYAGNKQSRIRNYATYYHPSMRSK